MGWGTGARGRWVGALAVAVTGMLAAGIAGATTVGAHVGVAIPFVPVHFRPYPPAGPVPAGLALYPAPVATPAVPWLLPGAGDTVTSAWAGPAQPADPAWEQVYGRPGHPGATLLVVTALAEQRPATRPDWCGRPGIVSLQPLQGGGPIPSDATTVGGQSGCFGPYIADAGSTFVDATTVGSLTWRWRDGVYGGAVTAGGAPSLAAAIRQPTTSVLGVDLDARRLGLVLLAQGRLGAVATSLVFRRGNCTYRLSTGTGSPDGWTLPQAGEEVPGHADTVESAPPAPASGHVRLDEGLASWLPLAGTFATVQRGYGPQPEVCTSGATPNGPLAGLHLREVTEQAWRAGLAARGVHVRSAQ